MALPTRAERVVEATERLLTYYSSDLRCLPILVLSDCEEVARQWVAEHDPTPLTVDWLRAVGFKHKHWTAENGEVRSDELAINFPSFNGDPQWLGVEVERGDDGEMCVTYWMFNLHRRSEAIEEADIEADLVNVDIGNSRGAVRTLCRALGCKLFEEEMT